MVDVHTPESRRKNMRAIRGKNTNPEVLVRKLLFSHGFRFRLHVKNLPSTPDIVLHKYRTIILVHGCFWHGHNCYMFKIPQTRSEFWIEKIKSNQQRDHRDKLLLLKEGWRVLLIWECALKGRLKWNADDLGIAISNWIRDLESVDRLFEIRHI